jgi:hypothetical protein
MEITRHKIQAELWMARLAQQSAGKFLLMAFWDAQDILLVEFLDHRVTVNAYHHCAIFWNQKEWIWIKKTLGYTSSLLKLNTLCIARTNS